MASEPPNNASAILKCHRRLKLNLSPR